MTISSHRMDEARKQPPSAEMNGPSWPSHFIMGAARKAELAQACSQWLTPATDFQGQAGRRGRGVCTEPSAFGQHPHTLQPRSSQTLTNQASNAAGITPFIKGKPSHGCDSCLAWGCSAHLQRSWEWRVGRIFRGSKGVKCLLHQRSGVAGICQLHGGDNFTQGGSPELGTVSTWEKEANFPQPDSRAMVPSARPIFKPPCKLGPFPWAEQGLRGLLSPPSRMLPAVQSNAALRALFEGALFIASSRRHRFPLAPLSTSTLFHLINCYKVTFQASVSSAAHVPGPTR